MIDYPSTYPLPKYGNYSATVIPGVIRTNLPTPKPSQIVGFNSPQTQISMTFDMSNDEYEAWDQWMQQYGWDWFRMPAVTPLPPVLITSDRRLRLVSEVQVTKIGDDWLSATVAAECIPGDDADPNAPLPVYPNLITAGTPATPSADEIIAGTPSSPSTDLIRSPLYYYE